jgi:hypothetical protein
MLQVFTWVPQSMRQAPPLQSSVQVLERLLPHTSEQPAPALQVNFPSFALSAVAVHSVPVAQLNEHVLGPEHESVQRHAIPLQAWLLSVPPE